MSARGAMLGGVFAMLGGGGGLARFGIFLFFSGAPSVGSVSPQFGAP